MKRRVRAALIVSAMAAAGLVLLAVRLALDEPAKGEAVVTIEEGRRAPPHGQDGARGTVPGGGPVHPAAGSSDRRIETGAPVEGADARPLETDSPLGALRVRVLDPGGAPEPDAVVEYTHAPGTPASATSADLRQVTVDENGDLLLRLPPGIVRLSAWTQGAAAELVTHRVEPGGDVEVELRLVATVAVEGLVLDAATGAPVAGAEVWVETFNALHRTASGLDGVYRLERFPVGSGGGFLRCNSPRHGTESKGLTVLEDGSFRVDLPGRDAHLGDLQRGYRVVRVDFELVPVRRIVGHVRNPEGRPITGARVRARGAFWIASNVAMTDEASAETDERGGFQLTPLRTDISHTVHVEADGLAAPPIVVPPGPGLASDLGTIVMEPEREILVTVIGADGLPVDGAKIALGPAEPRHDTEARPTDEEEAFPRDAKVRGGPLTRRTDTTGAATFEGLPPGAFELVVRMGGKEILRRELDLVPPPYATDVLVELSSEYLTVEGQVLRDGAPTPGVEVRLTPTNRKVTTDSAGRFVLTGIDGSSPWHSLKAVWRDPGGEAWAADARIHVDHQRFVRLELLRLNDGVK